MSEFSESYHLKGNDINSAIQIIKKTSSPGFVGKLCDNWLTLVPESAICGYDFNEKLIENNEGIIFHYVFPEDHGFVFRLFKENSLVCEYSIDVNEGDLDAGRDMSNLNSALFTELTGIAMSAVEFEMLLQPKTWDEYFSLPDKLMELLGIPVEAYKWLSYHYCELNKEDNPELAKQFIEV